jgi:hypothetical protein
MPNATPNTNCIPLPAGAITAERQDPSTRHAYRYFEIRRWLIEARTPIAVMVGGIQHPSGRVQPEVTISQLHQDDPITAAQARQLARVLIAAADEVELQASRDGDVA